MYRLGVAFHLKQQAENSDMRLRQYIGLMTGIYTNTIDRETMTDESFLLNIKRDQDEELAERKIAKK
jgi:hypothetical protein